jgi:hypothetical protein
MDYRLRPQLWRRLIRQVVLPFFLLRKKESFLMRITYANRPEYQPIFFASFVFRSIKNRRPGIFPAAPFFPIKFISGLPARVSFQNPQSAFSSTQLADSC